MTRINVYDIEAEKIEEIATENDVIEADVIEALFEALKDNNININDYI